MARRLWPLARRGPSTGGWCANPRAHAWACARLELQARVRERANVRGCAVRHGGKMGARRSGCGRHGRRGFMLTCSRPDTQTRQRPGVCTSGVESLPPAATPRSTANGTPASSARTVNWKKGRPCPAWRTRARACAWVHGCTGVCQGTCGAHRRQDRGGGTERRRRHGVRENFQGWPKIGRRAGCVRGGVGSSTCKRSIPILARRPPSQVQARRRGDV
jgi:hypothetical protein